MNSCSPISSECFPSRGLSSFFFLFLACRRWKNRYMNSSPFIAASPLLPLQCSDLGYLKHYPLVLPGMIPNLLCRPLPCTAAEVSSDREPEERNSILSVMNEFRPHCYKSHLCLLFFTEKKFLPLRFSHSPEGLFLLFFHENARGGTVFSPDKTVSDARSVSVSRLPPVAPTAV